MVDTSFARMKLFYFNVGKVLIGSYSALVLIVINSRTDAIYVFLQCGTGVFQQRGTGFTVLHWSAANNKTEAIRILLQHSASTTLKMTSVEHQSILRDRNHDEAVLLLQH